MPLIHYFFFSLFKLFKKTYQTFLVFFVRKTWKNFILFSFSKFYIKFWQILCMWAIFQWFSILSKCTISCIRLLQFFKDWSKMPFWYFIRIIFFFCSKVFLQVTLLCIIYISLSSKWPLDYRYFLVKTTFFPITYFLKNPYGPTMGTC